MNEEEIAREEAYMEAQGFEAWLTRRLPMDVTDVIRELRKLDPHFLFLWNKDSEYFELWCEPETGTKDADPYCVLEVIDPETKTFIRPGMFLVDWVRRCDWLQYNKGEVKQRRDSMKRARWQAQVNSYNMTNAAVRDRRRQLKGNPLSAVPRNYGDVR